MFFVYVEPKNQYAGEMISSWFNLFFYFIGILIIILIFIPKWGLVSFVKRLYRARDQILFEDALKYIQKCASDNHLATIGSLSGALRLSCESTFLLLNNMLEMGLINLEGQVIKLTDKGHQNWLRVIRAHRLSEQFLAQETGFPYDEIHQRAHKLEHRMTEEQVNRLSKRLGNPIYDPHGDPIPTCDGKIKNLEGQILTSVPENHFARIIHIEDEPTEIYSRLHAEGLHPGMDLQVLEKTGSGIRFSSSGGEYLLTPTIAANIQVVPLGEGSTTRKKARVRLSQLPVGGRAGILELSLHLRRNERRRLMDLGFIPGTIVEAYLKSSRGDPIAYRVRGSLIALRKEQTDWIFIEPLISEMILEGTNGHVL